jgi:Tfp pilus assembly protein PilV
LISGFRSFSPGKFFAAIRPRRSSAPALCCIAICQGAHQDRRPGVNGGARGAFTLIEALMATGILLVMVVAVTTAISAGQQHSYEAQQRIAASFAADELLGRIAAGSYNSLSPWDGHLETIGHMTDMKGQAMPPVYGMLGRRVAVTTSLLTVNPTLGVKVQGTTVRVEAFNAEGLVLATSSRFIPEPQS